LPARTPQKSHWHQKRDLIFFSAAFILLAHKKAKTKSQKSCLL
jgi:hypothetical protein